MDNKQFEIINQQFEKMNSRLDSVDQHLSRVDQHLSRVDQHLSRVDERLSHVDERLSRIEEDQHLIKRAVLDTNERVMKMESVLENQHRIIELLSTRSIQQEAELKRIK
ncbi:hypothetical protein [Paenibacillus apis]|uniref:t-SNARE coiled-coil homology domain-containing protein n=1 Tax=Paenibacillus apis TaxID=1792174 RepID=A0A919Y1E4_9BACL|nr:hypothetical protein [Paenibacillus apis]GIO40665.1 hypothetical protein J41TS4_04230 [Paenibacillus apis]